MHVTTTSNMQLIIQMTQIIHVYEEGECFAPLLPLGKVLQVSPINSWSQNESNFGIVLFFGALSHGDLDFFMDRPETLARGTFYHHCHDRKHENEAREAAKGQKH